ncbi:VOC family protein [Polymorphobacter fuscus]|nr:VOC family protein [Polymorphobacter fuscus]NJC08862.1 catechol 2,3-dioxygenase-like lactoylglutathione lyase family enzyme [Polymorphobacter fuscus]
MDTPSLMSHVSVGVADLDRASRFYDAVLATLGARRIVDEAFGIAYGRQFPEFWIGRPHDGQPPVAGNGAHFAFLAADRGQVTAFHAAALAAGGSDDGAPGPRPHYGAEYYGAFARDPDGNKIEAMVWEG